jgi:hypothetical protein
MVGTCPVAASAVRDLAGGLARVRPPATSCWHTGRCVERRERESILWEGVPRENVRRERAEVRAAEELAESPLVGRPLRRRYRNFRAAVDTYVAEHLGDPTRWERTVGAWDFYAVNELIDKHNRYFPIETRLPMDPRTRDFVLVNGRPYTREYLDAAWALERFPPGPLRP